MCGIAGIIRRQSDSDIIPILKGMNAAMSHRGPDDSGIEIMANGRVGFASRRLAIRDLSPAGHMPMPDEERNMWITYNGEVYNADVLREALQSKGYRFHSHSDTEVILKGYQYWGAEVITRLNGMFALAIYDAQKQQVLLARDRLGIKPLYYAITSESILFASEIRALLASQLICREVNPNSLIGYLALGSVPSPMSIYKGICSLEAANTLIIDLQSLKQTQDCYWQLPTETDSHITRAQALETVRSSLVDAVKIRLISDVPLGAFLSGGLDSSVVAALMRQAHTADIRTCSIVFEEATYSEASYARAVAKHIGAQHQEIVITANDILQDFDHILQASDQPSIDGVNTYFVSKAAREAGLTVALSGLGGDELFGGYPNTFGDVLKLTRIQRYLSAIPVANTITKAGLSAFGTDERWRRIGDALNQPPSFAGSYVARRGLFSMQTIQQLVSPDLLAESNFVPSAYITSRTPTQSHAFEWVSHAELRTYTHNQLLRDTDIMSMAHSLEVRVPLLDHHLVERILKLPQPIKTDKTGRPKPLLAEAASAWLPEIITQRRDKQGFTFPFALWMRAGLRPKIDDALQQTRQFDWINTATVNRLVNDFDAGRLHWSRLWALVVLQGLAR